MGLGRRGMGYKNMDAETEEKHTSLEAVNTLSIPLLRIQ